MDIVVANGFAMERCTFFSRENHCCVLHNTRCKCEDYNPRNSNPMTNADRLRAMTDKELAEFLYNHDFCISPIQSDMQNTCDGICGKCILDWLKSPAEPVEVENGN